MKRHYFIYFVLGVAAIFMLQTIFIFSLYQNFLSTEKNNVENALYESVGMELHYRKVKDNDLYSDVKYTKAIYENTDAYDLKYYPKELKEAVLEHLTTLPKPIRKEYYIPELIDKGVIRSAGDLDLQSEQDSFIKRDNFVNARVLDSLFDIRLGRGYSNRVALVDSKDSLLDASGAPLEFNYRSKPIQIGLQGLQKVFVEVDIKPSQFIKSSFSILILSFLVVMIPLISLIYFATKLRRKEEELKHREISINGIIHDLKSPLVRTYTMLDLFEMLETDDTKREMISTNMSSIMLLSSRIERLLYAAKDRVEVHKQSVKRIDIEHRIAILMDDLCESYKHKEIAINVMCDIRDVINIDTVCFDSIVTNLVENSIKYSKESVKVELSLLQDDNLLKITVTDNGIGIAAHNQRDIFKHLYRAKHNTAKGSGIGLAYIHSIALAHGGRVRLLASELNKFSKFEATINVD